uniref:Scaffolding anchor of CK1 domain-containing protein n=1 Tax=Sphenodon punctatus TaxID=8508 RepID=A0A8D0GJM7_SPHPU
HHPGGGANLRVGTTGGTEFFTRSATRFKGTLAQKFMFIDGDRAMSGSYSFTWSAARTDRNVISVLSGQVVEAFDKQFQELYLMSQGVNLKSIQMDGEPEPEPVFMPTVLPMSPTVVKKLINPKYALVKAKSVEQIKSKQEEANKNLPNEQKLDKKGKALPEGQTAERPSDLVDTSPPIHPGLLNLEKANMFDYLPTWAEPDPDPSEVLGYINIIDPKIKNIKLSQIDRIKICAFATLAITGDKEARPPVPKPRTIQIMDFISKNNVPLEGTTGSAEDAKQQHEGAEQDNEKPTMAHSTHVRQELSRQAAVSHKASDCIENGLQGGEDEEEEEDYVTISDQESFSGSSTNHSYRHSNASSISDEYVEVRDHFGPLRRTNSDLLPNGGHHHLLLQRKLSDPHISRGSYVSPLGSPQPGREQRGGGCTQRIGNRSTGPQFFHYGPRMPAAPGRGKEGLPSSQHDRCPGANKYRREGADAKKTPAAPGSQPYWQSKGFSSSKNTHPGHLSRGNARGGPSRPAGNPRSPFLESQRTAEEMRTPLGIPLSKLSQSKHLKNKAGQLSDAKQKPHGAPGPKEH